MDFLTMTGCSDVLPRYDAHDYDCERVYDDFYDRKDWMLAQTSLSARTRDQDGEKACFPLLVQPPTAPALC